MQQLYDTSDVQVKLLDTVRGVTADIVYVVHRRRFVGAQGQFAGIQADPTASVSATRAAA